MALNFPANPTVGQVYTVGNESWQWDGHCWTIAAGTATYSPVHVGQFPPGSPIAGDLWWNSTSGKLCIYYTDTDGSQWVSATQVPDPKVTVSSEEVVNSFLEELTPYANISAAVAGGVATGALFRVTAETGSGAIRAVASYGGGGGAGDKGQKGEDGTKGQKGEEGVATKGQKGEVGVTTKGQKGEAGTNGNDGLKGQKGQDGAAATKGQKGEVGTGTKGQKGEVGTGTKGQKGQDGTAGSNGTDGTKGQKGQTGSGTPAGSNTELQWNDNGSFGSNANLTWNDSLNILQALNATIIQLGVGTLSVTGNTTLGDASTDTITLTGEIDSHYIPTTNATYDLGDAEHKIRHLFLSDNSLKIGAGTSVAVEVGASANDNLSVSTGIETVGSILPTITNNANIGSAALKWNNGYFNLLHAGNYAFPTAVGTNGQVLASDGTNVTFQAAPAPVADPTFTGTVTLPEQNFNNNYANKAAAGVGALGDLAVIGGELCFHDGTDWKTITLGSAPA
jgi:hypothetical protein